MKRTRKRIVLDMIYIICGVFLCAFSIYMFFSSSESKEDQITGITLENHLYSEVDGMYVVKANSSDYIPEGERVMLYLNHINIEILVNGKVCFVNTEDNVIKWENFVSEGISPEDEITFNIINAQEVSKKLAYDNLENHLSYGAQIELLRQQVRKNGLKILLSALIFMMGLAMLIVSTSLSVLHIPDISSYRACGLLMMFGAICTFIDYEYITLIIQNVYFVNAIDTLTQFLIVAFLMIYLKYYIHTKYYRHIMGTLSIIWQFCMACFCAIKLTGIAPDEKYIWVFAWIGIVSLALEIYFLIHDFMSFQEQRTKRVILSGVILTAMAMIEIVHYSITGVFWIYIFQLGLILFTVVQFIVLLSYTRKMIRDAQLKNQMEAEMIQSRISIMMSQIQPHFLYNTLTVIYNLCGKNPKEAQETTAEFANYLRGNLDSLKKTEPVPFSTELKHVELYLNLEKKRFLDELNIIYDIQSTDFLVPALSIQPLVENAVKYGVGQQEDGGTVTIATRDCDTYYEIIVSDDGVGYDVYETKDDGRTHIGIDNVKNRLEAMVHGTLEIVSVKGQGTTATVRIPKGIF